MPYYTRHVRGPDTVHSFRSESNKLFLEDHVQTEIIRPAFDFFRNLNDRSATSTAPCTGIAYKF